MKNEKFGLTGKIKLELRDSEGKIKEVREMKNLVVSAGKAEVAALLLTDIASDDYDEIAIGTGTTAPVAGNTILETEITTGGGDRLTAGEVTGTRITTTTTDDTAQLVGTFAFTSSFAVTEAGLFNDASTGDMLARQTFSAINVVNGDSLQVTWQIQVS